MSFSILRILQKKIVFLFHTPVSCYSQQISFGYWKRHGDRNTKIRHHNRINTFLEFHEGYISDGRVLKFRTYILSYSEDYYQLEISMRTTPLF